MAAGEGVIWVNGELSSPAQARVSVLDAGFLYGDGVFETLRTYGGRPFLLHAHLARLLDGARALALPSPPSLETLTDAVGQALEAAALPEATLRITLTRGEGTLGLEPDGFTRATCVIAVLPLRTWPEALYTHGATLVTLWRRSAEDRPGPAIKSLSYQRALLGRQSFRARGADEGLYLDEGGNITEGTVSNVFAVRAGKLVTPPAEVCLPGITRREVLDLARDLELDVREAPLKPEDLSRADEVFLTGSLAELVPCVRFDRAPIGKETPGPVWERLHAAYRSFTQVELP